MFVFMGEEISWGQRIFDITPPEILEEINVQNEINLHNMKFMDDYFGGKYNSIKWAGTIDQAIELVKVTSEALKSKNPDAYSIQPFSL